jgi:geranylgeranyl pyrophosphate synthase
MTTQHTPGPWRYFISANKTTGQRWSNVTGDGLQIAGAVPSESDARLIAAAPELLDTLKLLFEDWVTLVGDDCEDNEDVRRIWQACQDALTKATGEPVMAA